MPMLSRSYACSAHIAHAESAEVYSYDHATAVFMLALVNTGDDYILRDTMQKWLSHDGDEAFTITFVDAFGTEQAITYAV